MKMKAKFLWCVHHHGNGMFFPAESLDENKPDEYKGPWKCTECSGLMLSPLDPLGECR